MPVCLYLRGAPGTGKDTVSSLLVRDLGWPRVWVHDFDAIYTAIGQHKVPDLTDKLIRDVASYLIDQKRNLIVVRPSRQTWGMEAIRSRAAFSGYELVVVKLVASYATLVTRVTRRWTESPFRLTTKESLDEYLGARKEEVFPGEIEIDTTSLTPEVVAGRIKELLPK
jgi:broad-specificity NMP kinase